MSDIIEPNETPVDLAVEKASRRLELVQTVRERLINQFDKKTTLPETMEEGGLVLLAALKDMGEQEMKLMKLDIQKSQVENEAEVAGLLETMLLEKERTGMVDEKLKNIQVTDRGLDTSTLSTPTKLLPGELSHVHAGSEDSESFMKRMDEMNNRSYDK